MDPNRIKKLSVIIPVFNEKATIGQVVRDVQAVTLQKGIEKEIIVVDDGSSDGTQDTLNELDQQDGLRVFYQTENKGKTSAVKFGLGQITGDAVVIQDADLEYSPREYPRLLEPILRGEAKVVYGSRFLGSIRNMTVVNRVANTVSNWTINGMYGASLSDFHTCLKVFRHDALEHIVIRSRKFTFDTEITAQLLKQGVRIKEIPIDYNARLRSQGKKITWSEALETYGFLWRDFIKWRFVETRSNKQNIRIPEKYNGNNAKMYSL